MALERYLQPALDRYLLPDVTIQVKSFLMPYKAGDMVVVRDFHDFWWLARVESELVFHFLGFKIPRHVWHMHVESGGYYHERAPDRLLDVPDFARPLCIHCDAVQFSWTNGFIFSVWKPGESYHEHRCLTHELRALIATNAYSFLCDASWQSKCTCP